MAYDPFAQGSALDPNAYMDFLSQPGDPRLLAAGLSAGLSMLQPPRWGDTGVSQIARAIGTGGESAALGEAQRQKAQESQSKMDVAEARAEAARSRAGAAGDRLGYQAERLALLKSAQEGLNERSRLSRLVQAQGQYNQYRRAVDSNNLLAASPTPALSFQDWLTQNGLSGLLVSGGGEAPAQPTLGATVAAPTEAQAAPPAPTDPSKRTPNTVYTTPRGELKWTGTGWIPAQGF